MASIRSIRKRGQLHMGQEVRMCGWLASWDSWGSFPDMDEALAFLATLRKPEHFYAVGDHATRCGTDVQVVDAVAGNCADFRCIKAPLSGWCEVGDVEHNLMRRYQPLSPDEVDSMLAQAPDAMGAPATA